MEALLGWRCIHAGHRHRQDDDSTENQAHSSVPLSSMLAASLRGQTHVAPRGEVDGRVENDPIALLDPAVHFHPRAHVAGHPYLADFRLAVLNNRDLQALSVEGDCLRGDDERRRLARNLEFDEAVHPGAQRALRIGKINLGQKRARAALLRVGDPGHLARKLAVGELREESDAQIPERILHALDLTEHLDSCFRV